MVFKSNSVVFNLFYLESFLSKIRMFISKKLFIILFLLSNLYSVDSLYSKDFSADSLEPIKILVTKNGLNVPVYSFEAFSEKVLSKKDNSLLVINYWATWCKPCVEELPIFFEMEEKFKDKNVAFVFVSLDFTKQLEKSLVPFLDKHNIKSKVVVLDQKNANEWMDKIEKDWSGSIPATLFYNSKHRKFHEGKFEKVEDLEKIINSIIEQ